MRKIFRKRTKKAGLPPGTLIHVGEKRMESVRLSVFRYNKSEVERYDDISIDRLPDPADGYITWYHLDGLHDVNIIESIGKRFTIHPLLLEDIINTEQRPKIEDHGDYLFIILKMLNYDDATQEVRQEQVAFIIGKNYLISFHENEKEFFNPIRDRINSGKGRIRTMGSDYLTYALMDAIVDNYYTIFDKLGDAIEQLEATLITNPTTELLHTINSLKREMLFLRKNIWPLREIIAVMERRESPLIKQAIVVYLRDMYDHTIQVIDTIETMRDILTGMLDVYLSSISNRTNQVMKVLTIIATIFIPLTFIVGIYGMNFEYMPELGWRWGYPGIMIFMFVLGIGMVLYFRRRGWL
jgi:magnesium transporter